MKDCLDGFIGWMAGVVDQEACASSAGVPCPDIEATALLEEYVSSQTPVDLFGKRVTPGGEDERFDAAVVVQTALDEATDAISDLVRRVNFASSIYVLYLAFLVVVTPPFIVYG